MGRNSAGSYGRGARNWSSHLGRVVRWHSSCSFIFPCTARIIPLEFRFFYCIVIISSIPANNEAYILLWLDCDIECTLFALRHSRRICKYSAFLPLVQLEPFVSVDCMRGTLKFVSSSHSAPSRNAGIAIHL